MTKRTLENQVYEWLYPHSSPNMPLTRGTLRYVDEKDMIKIYEKLSSEVKFNSIDGICRADCPSYPSLARLPYKKGMNDYLSQFGLSFEVPHVIPAPLYESLANYLESINPTGI